MCVCVCVCVCVCMCVCVCVFMHICMQRQIMSDNYERGCSARKKVVWADSVSVSQHQGVFLVLWTWPNTVSVPPMPS